VSQVETVLDSFARLHAAARTRSVPDPGGAGGVSARQAAILALLDAHDPAMVGELAEHLGVTASTMSVNLQRLERDGFVRRDRDPADRRVTNVRLTEAGVRTRDARRLLAAGRVAGILDLLSPHERAEAVRGLRLLASAADRFQRRGARETAATTGVGLEPPAEEES